MKTEKKKNHVFFAISCVVAFLALSHPAKADGHMLEHAPEQPATCTKNGTVEYWRCTDCGKLFADDAGLAEITLDDVMIPATGHTPQKDPAVPPTETETGLSEGSHCTVCGEVLVEREVIPKLGTETEAPSPTQSPYAASGKCGNGIEWTLSQDGTKLVLFGKGSMSNYSGVVNSAPWYEYAGTITSVSLSYGITSIGSYAFSDCVNLLWVNLPASVAQLGDYCFSGCSRLQEVSIPNGKALISDSAFLNCPRLVSPTPAPKTSTPSPSPSPSPSPTPTPTPTPAPLPSFSPTPSPTPTSSPSPPQEPSPAALPSVLPWELLLSEYEEQGCWIITDYGPSEEEYGQMPVRFNKGIRIYPHHRLPELGEYRIPFPKITDILGLTCADNTLIE